MLGSLMWDAFICKEAMSEHKVRRLWETIERLFPFTDFFPDIGSIWFDYKVFDKEAKFVLESLSREIEGPPNEVYCFFETLWLHRTYQEEAV